MGTLKCVLVGNPGVGKTSLIVAYTRNGFADRYVPTAFDNYSVTVNVDNKPLRMDLCDTAGRSEFDSLRPLSYAEADVFLLCFKVNDSRSLSAITDHWLPEIRAVAPQAPVIFVGTQRDVRITNSLIDTKRIKRIAEQMNSDYIECSALTHRNLKEVFDLAILHGLTSESKRRHVQSSIAKKNLFVSPSNPPAEKNRQTPLKDGFRRLVTMTRRIF